MVASTTKVAVGGRLGRCLVLHLAHSGHIDRRIEQTYPSRVRWDSFGAKGEVTDRINEVPFPHLSIPVLVDSTQLD